MHREEQAKHQSSALFLKALAISCRCRNGKRHDMPLILVLFFASGYCFLPAIPCGRKSVCSQSIRAKTILSRDPNAPCFSKQRSMPLPSLSKVGSAAAPGAEQGFMFPAQGRKIGAGWEQLPPWCVQQLHRRLQVWCLLLFLG